MDRHGTGVAGGSGSQAVVCFFGSGRCCAKSDLSQSGCMSCLGGPASAHQVTSAHQVCSTHRASLSPAFWRAPPPVSAFSRQNPAQSWMSIGLPCSRSIAVPSTCGQSRPTLRMRGELWRAGPRRARQTWGFRPTRPRASTCPAHQVCRAHQPQENPQRGLVKAPRRPRSKPDLTQRPARTSAMEQVFTTTLVAPV